MANEWITYEFDANNSVKAKVECITVNHQPATKRTDVLLFLYLKQTDTTAPVIYDPEAKIYANGNNYTWYFIENSFLSIPNDNQWHKVGLSLLYAFPYKEEGLIFKKYLCRPKITIYGSVGGITVHDHREITFENLPKPDSKPRSNIVGPDKVSYNIGDTISLSIDEKYEDATYRLRYCWGAEKNDYKCFYKDESLNSSIHSNDSGWLVNTLLNPMPDNIYFNLVSDGYSSLQRSNETVNKTRECCAIILESHATEFLGSSVYLAYFAVNNDYKPSITPNALETINDNELVAQWNNITLQGYSKVRATCSVSKSVEGDNATIIEYSISDGKRSSISMEFVSDIIQTSGLYPVSFSAIDSRGRKTNVVATVSVVTYYAPQVSFDKLYRCDKNGVFSEQKEFFYVKPNAYYASCENHNSISVTCRWKLINEVNYPADNVIELSDEEISQGKVVTGNLDSTKAYMLKLEIKDTLGSETEEELPLTSSKVLLHFNAGGRSLGIGIYNYEPQSCKVGYKFLLGELGIDAYIRSQVADSVIEYGQTEGVGRYPYYLNGTTAWKDFNVQWYYEKYYSGKVVLYGTGQITNLDPYNSGYTIIRILIPVVNGTPLFNYNQHRAIEISGSGDCNPTSKGQPTWLIKNKDTLSYGQVEYMFYRPTNWEENEISPILNFKIVVIPK